MSFLWPPWNFRKEVSVFLDGSYKNSELLSGISVATISMRLNMHTYININITSRRERETLYADLMKRKEGQWYLNPLNTLFLCYLILLSIVHTGSIFLSKKGKCSQYFSNIPNAEAFISFMNVTRLKKKSKWAKKMLIFKSIHFSLVACTCKINILCWANFYLI